MTALVTRRTALVAVLLPAVLLSSCSWFKPDPQQLIEQAVRATQALQSVAFDLTLTMSDSTNLLPPKSTLSIHGSMVRGGELMGGAVAFRSDSSESPLTFEGVVLKTQNDAVDLRIDTLEGTLPALLQPLAKLPLATWVRLSEGESGAVVTPEPQLLAAQAQTFHVDEDLGTETIDGVQVAHYRVTIDQEKLHSYLARAASNRGESPSASLLSSGEWNGEVWIEEKTAFIRRVMWLVTDTSTNKEVFTIDLLLRDHNHAAEPQSASGVRSWEDLQEEDDTMSSASSSSSSDA